MAHAPAIRPDYTSMSTEALAKLAHNRATGPYSVDQGLAMIVAELARRQVAAEAALQRVQGWIEHWKLDAECDLKPTDSSLASAAATCVSALPKSRTDLVIERHRREIAAENAEDA